MAARQTTNPAARRVLLHRRHRLRSIVQLSTAFRSLEGTGHLQDATVHSLVELNTAFRGLEDADHLQEEWAEEEIPEI